MGNTLANVGETTALFHSIFTTIIALALIIFGFVLIFTRPAQSSPNILLGIILIVIGILVTIASWVWYDITKQNRTVAQIQGGLAVADFTKDAVKDIF